MYADANQGWLMPGDLRTPWDVATATECAHALERSAAQFHDHEHVRWNRILPLEPFGGPRDEPKPRVVLRMPNDHDDVVAECAARIETSIHESRTDAAPLVLRQHGHRRQTGRADRRRRSFDSNRREENVADDAIAVGGDE